MVPAWVVLALAFRIRRAFSLFFGFMTKNENILSDARFSRENKYFQYCVTTNFTLYLLGFYRNESNKVINLFILFLFNINLNNEHMQNAFLILIFILH